MHVHVYANKSYLINVDPQVSILTPPLLKILENTLKASTARSKQWTEIEGA